MLFDASDTFFLKVMFTPLCKGLGTEKANCFNFVSRIIFPFLLDGGFKHHS